LKQNFLKVFSIPACSVFDIGVNLGLWHTGAARLLLKLT
jgi:hypothetical protein